MCFVKVEWHDQVTNLMVSMTCLILLQRGTHPRANPINLSDPVEQEKNPCVFPIFYLCL